MLALNTQIIPEKVLHVLDLDFGSQITTKILDQAKLSSADRSSVIDWLEFLFFKKISLDEFVTNLQKLKLDEEVKKQLVIDFLGQRLLIIDDYFNGEVKKKLLVLNVDPEVYASEIKRQQELLAAWQKRNDDLKYVPVPALDDYEEVDEIVVENEKIGVQSSFKDGLVLLLQTDSADEEMVDVNLAIISCLVGDKEFQTTLINLLMANQEVLTQEDIQNANETLVGTVSNWLKDYNSTQGAQALDSLSITKYLAMSSNVAKLSPESRRLVERLLKLYRNIATFPNNIKSEDPVEWQMFPVASSEILDKARTVDLPSIAEKPVVIAKSKPAVKIEVDKSTQKLKDLLLVHQETIKALLPEDKLNLGLEKALVLQGTKLISAFWQSINQDLFLTVELLKRIALDQGLWQVWLSSSELKVYVSANITNFYPGINLDQVALGMATDGLLLEVFKNIFKKLKLGDSQSAEVFSFAVSGNKRLSAFVYADLKEERFAWRKVELRGNELVVV